MQSISQIVAETVGLLVCNLVCYKTADYRNICKHLEMQHSCTLYI